MKLLLKRSIKTGLPPETLISIGEIKVGKSSITVFTYTKDHFEEKVVTPDELPFYKNSTDVVWINVDGVNDVETLEKVGALFDIHGLALEDVVNTDQRPKVEEHDRHLFVVLKMIYLSKESSDIEIEQVSFLLNKNILLSFQERKGDVFDLIRKRIRNGKGRVRGMGADYLVYTLMDAIIDNYFVIMEQLGDQIELLESELIGNTDTTISMKIHELRRKVILLRRSIWPLREVVNSLLHSDVSYMRKTTLPFIRDLYDHTIHIIETLETFRDVLSGMRDIYLSSVSNRMNEIMKVLTIIATVFMPLSFIAGVYGMNFKYMPELEWRWGYAGVLILMLMFIIGFFGYFRHRKWL